MTNILVFDTETYGLDPRIDSLLSLGALVGDLDTGKILESWEVFHKMGNLSDYRGDQKALAVNKLTIAEVFEKGLPASEICDKFMDMFVKNKCTLLGGHNVIVFDVPMVAHQLFDCEPREFINNTSYRFIDTMPLIRLFAGSDSIKGASLKDTIKALGIDMSDIKGGFHGALFDAIGSFRIMCRFRKVLTMPEVVTLLKNE